MERLTSVSDSLVERYRQLSRTTKLILLAWVCVQLCLTAIVWYLGPSNIFACTSGDTWCGIRRGC